MYKYSTLKHGNIISVAKNPPPVMGEGYKIKIK
jgi:hypothetical protein